MNRKYYMPHAVAALLCVFMSINSGVPLRAHDGEHIELPLPTYELEETAATAREGCLHEEQILKRAGGLATVKAQSIETTSACNDDPCGVNCNRGAHQQTAAQQQTGAWQPGEVQWYEAGYASWYAGRFQGRRTANGEVFDTNLLTAAHKTLPFNTIVRVYNPQNEKSVLVRINDRGPFVEGRVIDLSRAAANQIGLTASGIGQVQLQIVRHGETSEIVVIQLGSFSQYDNAIDLVDELKRQGISSQIENDERGLFRVIIPSIERSQVDTVLSNLAAKGYSDTLVRVR